MPRKGEKPARDRRKNPVGMDPRRIARRERAAERDITYRQRTREEQLALLSERPGRSQQERARLVKKEKES